MGHLKIYRSKTYLRVHTLVYIKDNKGKRKSVSVDFENGQLDPIRINGTFSTTDERIQKALENRADFDRKFEIIHSDEPVNTEELPDTEVIMPEDEETDPNLEASIPDVLEINKTDKKTENIPDETGTIEGKTFNEVTTAQQAKDILVQHPEVSYRMVSNKQKVFEVAKNYNVQFPNLTK